MNAPDTYMEKLAVGPGYPDGTIDLTRPVADNIRSIAKAKGVEPNEITACVLDRDRAMPASSPSCARSAAACD